MSTIIALHWNEKILPFIVLQDGQVEAAASATLEADMDPTAIGRKLAEALEPYSPGRAKVIVAIGRGDLEWQHLSLPPCPADELPDVVRLQTDRDFGTPDEELGFDYLTLAGDEQTPYEVLTTSLEATELDKIRQVCRVANLALERIVPLAAGWHALTNQASPAKSGTQIYVAPLAKEATLWATREGRAVLFRQFQLAAAEDPTAMADAVGSELRRTLLGLSQHAETNEPTISLVGHQRDQLATLARTLDEKFDATVQSLDITAQHPSLATEAIAIPVALPLVGLGVDEGLSTQPLVDLLHPHQPPQKQINVRTYSLAALAATLLVALLGWTSYAKLQAPLNQAAKDQAELTILEESLDEFEEYEQRAAAIRDWQTEAPNLLVHLQKVSKSIRPQILEAEDFPVDKDVVLEKMEFDKRQLTIDALARNSRAVQPLEARLREATYRPQRGKSDSSQTVKEYPWHFKSTIEITPASDTANIAPTEEPKS